MSPDSLKVYLFNVGAGDHIMLEFPDGSLGIIDSYFSNDVLNLQEPPALTYLKYRIANEKKKTNPGKVIISFICISHADSDHVKGIERLFKIIIKESDFVTLQNLWLFGGHNGSISQYLNEIKLLRKSILENVEGQQEVEYSIRTDSYLKSLDEINEFKKKWTNNHRTSGEFYFNDFGPIKRYGNQKAFSAYSLGPIARITNQFTNSSVRALIRQLFEKVQNFTNRLSNDHKISFTGTLNRNSLSAILSIHFHNYNLIFTGDATKETLSASLEDIPNRIDWDVDPDPFNPDFVKASHHGSKHSSSKDIWQKLYESPKGDLLIGVSAGLKHAHPHDELFQDVSNCCNLRNVKSHIFRTNECLLCPCITKLEDEKIDLDVWFQYHGCKVRDLRTMIELHNAKPRTQNKTLNKEEICDKNLLAFIFEFPANGTNEDIKVYRGVSENIGKYIECKKCETNRKQNQSNQRAPSEEEV